MSDAMNRSAGSVQASEPLWTTKQTIYMCITGPFFLAAALEWVMHLGFFLFCFLRVYQKAAGSHKCSVRILCVFHAVFMVGIRGAYLLSMVFTLPLPTFILQFFPDKLVKLMTEFALWSFAALLEVPALICVWQLVTHNVGREPMITSLLDEITAPKVVIIMPCFNKEPHILLRTIDSIVDCEYSPSCMHIFLSFDGDRIEGLFLNTLEKLGVPVPLEKYETSIDLQYRGCRITVSRFPHGGKRNCQKLTCRVVDKVNKEYLKVHDDLFVLFIDSDCILDKFCIQNFMYEMELKPGSKQQMNAMTGVITATTVKNNFWTVLQDMEYIHGQIFERSVESACGAVTCLPGALTMLRFSAFKNMSKYYFADNVAHCNDMFDYGKCHLGEDRWLTHLFMIGATGPYQIQMNSGAFCKTEAVQTFKSLLKQRRRWFLGFITNEVCMLTDVRLWRRYPFVLVLRWAQNTIRTTALLFSMMLISVIAGEKRVSSLPLEFIAFSLCLNWGLMIYLGFNLHRYKLMLYPLMFLANPILNLAYMFQAILTAGQRTWGGPRADAEKADEDTTPIQAVAQAEANGDDMNVVPETFRYSGQGIRSPLPLMPPSYVEGRFVTAAAAAEPPGLWFQQADHSFNRGPETESTSSLATNATSYNPVPIPRRIESLMGSEDVIAYQSHRAGQGPAGGAFLEADAGGRTSSASDQELLLPKTETATRPPSAASDSSVSLHFDIPYRSPVGPPTSQNDLQRESVPLPSAIHQYPAEWRRSMPHGSTFHAGHSLLTRKSFERVATSASSPNHTMSDLELDEFETTKAAGHEGQCEHQARRKRNKLTKKRPDGQK